MEPKFLNVFPEFIAVHQSQQEEDIVPGEKRKYISPSCRNDPKLEALQTFLIDWINTTLKHEHIVVRSLEHDLYDGLVLHHLLEELGSVTLEVEKIALTEKKQQLKLTIILETVNQLLHLDENELKWSVNAIFKKDLLSTLHLLVAIAEHFQPDLAMPSNVKVDVINIECTANGLKTENAVEFITKNRSKYCTVVAKIRGKATDARVTSVKILSHPEAEIFDELLKHAPEKLDAVKEVLLKFVNKHVEKLGLSVNNVDSQFADGVILLLLIGQLRGYFLNLGDFFLNPSSVSEMVHNVNFALELLMEEGLLDTPINPEDVVNRDLNATLLILYCLYSKYKTKGHEKQK